MTVAVPPSEASLVVDPVALRRKVAWRIVPLIFLLYIVAYLDRANVGFAKLRMQDALHFSDEVIGWGLGLFFAGYLLLEIPGALLVERWSARKWFARILVSWGIVSMGMALVQTPWQFYLARILLGLAEAGFFPGVIVYFSHWFPRADRGRALAGMVLGIPISLALGAHVSGRLLEATWFGLDGWQWVFLVEGLPAVLLGVAVPFLLTDRPRHARWLSAAERSWLEETLETERREAAATGGGTIKQALSRPTVWLLALGIFATNLGGYVLVFWLPTVIENLLKTARGRASPVDTLQWTGLIYLCGLVGVIVSGQLSDRTGERKWCCVIGQVGTGLFLAISLIQGQPLGMVFAWLFLMGFFSVFWCSPFWVLPTQALSASVAAIAIGLINMFANLAGLIGSPVVGVMKDRGYGYPFCLSLVAMCYVTGGLILAFLPRRTVSSNQ